MKRKELRRLEDQRKDCLKVKRLLLEELKKELNKELNNKNLSDSEKRDLLSERLSLKVGL